MSFSTYMPEPEPKRQCFDVNAAIASAITLNTPTDKRIEDIALALMAAMVAAKTEGSWDDLAATAVRGAFALQRAVEAAWR